MLTLVTGPAWSGKTAFVETLVPQMDAVVWFGTGSRLDPGFSNHIDLVASRRPAHWQTIEAPMNLTEALHTITDANTPIVIDSVSQWAANLVARESSKYSSAQLIDHMANECHAFMETVTSLARVRAVFVVTAEFGWSVAPDLPLQATLRRVVGTMNQQLAALSSPVYLLCAGIGQIIKK